MNHTHQKPNGFQMSLLAITLISLSLASVSLFGNPSYSCAAPSINDDCDVSKGDVMRVYDSIQNKIERILMTKKGNTAMVKYMIEEFDYSHLKQLCINSRYKIHMEGKDYLYKNFTEKYGLIARTYFDNNTVFILMLAETRKLVDDNWDK
jgi:hypothetical protein